MKKNYINDLITHSKGAQNITNKMFVVVAELNSIVLQNYKKTKSVRRKKVEHNSDTEEVKLEINEEKSTD